MIVAVIPARGGSKRILRKNIRDFCGKPMIVWSIEAARAAGCFDEIAVSTDDEAIAAVARAAGAATPFVRPAALADDHAGTGAVMRHALDWYADAGRAPAFACCLYATAPFVQSADLADGLRALRQAGADYALAVTRYAFPIQRALRVNASGGIEMLRPDLAATRSQDLEEAWHDAGQFCWGRAEAWRASVPVFASRCVPVPLPRHRVQDIDTAEDWGRAEWMFRALAAQTAAE